MLEQPVVDEITKKIITQVRTIKSRIDAPVSLNRTITPLISEITAEMSKQVDIDIKKAMGGKEGKHDRGHGGPGKGGMGAAPKIPAPSATPSA